MAPAPPLLRLLLRQALQRRLGSDGSHVASVEEAMIFTGVQNGVRLLGG